MDKLNRNTVQSSPAFQNSRAFPSDVEPAILHFGIGAFHRSHQAYYLQQLYDKDGRHAQWQILGVCILPGDRHFVTKIKNQQGLYSLRMVDSLGQSKTAIISSIQDVLHGAVDLETVVRKIASSVTKVVSFTITEGGYHINTLTGSFHIENPDIQYDLIHQDDVPKTLFGYLARGLAARKAGQGGRLVLLSCDNLQENGHVLRRALTAFLMEYDPELLPWVDENVAFPNGMVDRITPRATEEDIVRASESIGLCDEVPVVSEHFIQWVLERPLGFDFPELDKVGVTFVDDVKMYEKMKLGILNGGHSLVGLIGDGLGYTHIHESIKDARIAGLFGKYVSEEVIPALDPIDGVDFRMYFESVSDRFANELVKDTNARIISDSSGKFPKFILPIIQHNLGSRGRFRLGTLVVVAWWSYLRRLVGQGDEGSLQDPMKDALVLAMKDSDPIGNFLNMREIFGDLHTSSDFVALFRRYAAMVEHGSLDDLVLEILNDINA